MKSNKWLSIAAILAAIGLGIGVSDQAGATIVNFDSQGLFGPSTFVAAGPVQHLNINTADGLVQFDSGVILTNTTFFPANHTSIYGTAFFGQGTTPSLTITFANAINNFFMDLYNGQTYPVDYT